MNAIQPSKRTFLRVTASLFLLATSALAQGVDVTAPGIPIVGVAAIPGSMTSSLAVPGTIPNVNNYPAAESPPNAIDDVVATKYLNFQKTMAGFIVTPSGPTVIGGLRFTTANDSPERDPIDVLIEGSLDASATTTLNSTWVPVYSGVSGLATDPGRLTPGLVVNFPNSTPYNSYRMLVWFVRDTPVLANSLQFAEIELFASASGSSFCNGDGSATACPCGNNSPTGANSGCVNSLGTGGKITASGMPSITSDSLVLSGTQMANSSALYFQGTAQVQSGSGVVFGDGLRCAGGSVIRLGIATNVAGASHYPGAGNQPIHVKGQVLAPGTRVYQVWYRNAAPFCNAETFNLTNGWTVAWVP